MDTPALSLPEPDPAVADVPARLRTLLREEHGFGLTELVIVMVIITILGAVAIPQFVGAKQTGTYNVAVADAKAYAQAISGYSQDNGNLVPAYPSTDWPDARGPLNTMLKTADNPNGRPYLPGGAPQDITQGTTTLGTGATPSGTGPNYIGMTPGPCANCYTLDVFGRSNESMSWTDPAVKHCVLAVGAPIPSGVNPCT
jgi:prepilin-type N-terminal cleavage/methylation domain-containing protein